MRNSENFEVENDVPNTYIDASEDCNRLEEVTNSGTEDSSSMPVNSNLISLRNFGNSRESDLDSNISSDSNRLFEESQNLANSGSFSSTEKLKELCDSENERCKTPSEQIPDKETIKKKLNELNKKKLKNMANIGVPTIEEDGEIVDKNDKNRPVQSQGCRPKIFSNSPDVSSLGITGQDTPNLLQSRPKTRTRSINVHKLRQEINERLKQEEVQARLGELAAGGGWDSFNTEREKHSVSSHRRYTHQIYDARNRRNSSNSEPGRNQTVPNEYALPQPSWPCGEVNPSDNEPFIMDCNNSNSNMLNNRRSSTRSYRKKMSKKTKAL